MSKPIIVALRRDFRLDDNPALYHAAEEGQVIPVYVLDESAAPPVQSASFWWLIQSLKSLSLRLADRGVSLILRRGQYAVVLANLAASIGAYSVFWNEGIFPGEKKQDEQLRHRLSQHSVPFRVFPANYSTVFGTVMTQQNTPYRLYSPFFQQVLSILREQTPRVLPAPGDIKGFGVIPSDSVRSWESDASLNSGKLALYWQPGEEHQRAHWQHFLETSVEQYDSRGTYDNERGSSKLSGALHFGEISIRRVMKDLVDHYDVLNGTRQVPPGIQTFFKQLMWREFSAYLLYHFPSLADTPADRDWISFPWRHAPKSLKSWQEGHSGYPIIDAGMRQLRQMGWIPNRIRMIVASFLVKDLLISWQEGAKWFRERLVDADEASNGVSWQWISGTGFDHIPFFRIYNPVTQSHKFDSTGDYIRMWIPELAKLPLSLLHAPWQAPRDVLESFGVHLGDNYPLRIVHHEHARQRALNSYAEWKKPATESGSD